MRNIRKGADGPWLGAGLPAHSYQISRMRSSEVEYKANHIMKSTESTRQKVNSYYHELYFL